MSKNALTSLWGAGHQEAVAKANAKRVRDCVAMEGEAEQEVLTPPSVVEALQRLWPEGVQLDPCAPVDGSLVPTAHQFTGEPLDGLREPWMDRTYANPPYGSLEQWLAKGQNEADRDLEVVMLVPVRTHRRWFKLNPWPRVCFMRPLTFVGFTSPFPAPLVTLYSGTRLTAFEEAFSTLGRIGSFLETYVRQRSLL